MLQLHKIFSLLISSFARPLITYTKQYELQRKKFSHSYMRIFFIFMGHKYSAFEMIVNRRLNKISLEEIQKHKALTDDEAYFFVFCVFLYSNKNPKRGGNNL